VTKSETPEAGKNQLFGSDSLRMWLDEPKGQVLRERESRFGGWGISARRGVLDHIVLRTSCGVLNFQSIDRPDVEQSYPKMYVLGFRGTLLVADHLAAVENGKLKIIVLLGKRVLATFQLRLAPGVIGEATQDATGY
jgi:hypothetical protein